MAVRSAGSREQCLSKRQMTTFLVMWRNQILWLVLAEK